MSLEDGFVKVDSKKYHIITLDFETYYSKDYTLTKSLSTSEYIRDKRFLAHGVGIKVGSKETRWYTGGNIKKALQKINWAACAMLAHNTAFDGFICSHVYGVKPAMYLDTLSMARAVHGAHVRHDLDTVAKAHGLAGKVKREALADTKGKSELTADELRALGDYCIDDVDDTYKVFWKLYDHFPDSELQLVDLTLRMFCDPVLRINTARVRRELAAEIGGKVAAVSSSGTTAKELLSNEKLATLLRDERVIPPTKISPTTGNIVYSFAKTDQEFQALRTHSNPKVAALVNARLRVKSTIGETRAARLLEAGKNGMPLPVLLNYAGAHTLRWSGGNKMNLQNLKRGGELRRAILAPPGQVIVVSDSSQIEARVLAWLAGQSDMVRAFAEGKDVYRLMASAIYGKPVDQITSDERFIGKICVLGLGYGMGHTKLRETLRQGVMGPPMELPIADCERIVAIYRARNANIAGFWKTAHGILTSMTHEYNGTYGPFGFGKGYIRLPNGLFLQYPELRESGGEFTYLTRTNRSRIYGGLLTENIVQALARCIVADQMLEISKQYRVVTMSHDEIVAVCPKADAKVCLKYMLDVMATAPNWAKGLPLDAKGSYARNYSK